MPSAILGRVAPSVALLLLGALPHADAQTFFPDDAVINYTVSNFSYVGYANQNDLNAKTNGTSPAISLINGGSVDSLFVYNNSTVNFSGNSVANGVSAYNTATVNFVGGSVTGVNAYNGSRINVSGGHVLNFIIGNTSLLNLFGTRLSATVVGDNFTFTNYTLAGTLIDGTTLNGTTLAVAKGSSAQFTLNNVPEPGGIALTIGMAGAGLLVRRRRA